VDRQRAKPQDRVDWNVDDGEHGSVHDTSP
jgi:hypothetical protein